MRNISLQVLKIVQKELTDLIRNNIHNYIEYAQDYAAAGFYEEGIGCWKWVCSSPNSIFPWRFII